MQKKVGIIHTSFVSVEALKELFNQIIPDVKLFNIVDDSMLDEVKTIGRITPSIVRRYCKYAVEAQSLGANLILNQCSSVGEAADIARQMLSIPLVKIDEAMAKAAVEIGGRIAVVATVQSTVKPSCNLITKTAELMGKKVEVNGYLVDGALDVLMSEGGQEKHNRMVREMIDSIGDDVIVLAQGSMTVLLPELMHIKKPIITSPKLAVQMVKDILEDRL